MRGSRTSSEQPTAARSLAGCGSVASIRTLGRFAVFLGVAELRSTAWDRRKARELLWLLCARDSHAIERESAVELLWPGATLAAGKSRLRVALHSLRSTLSGQCWRGSDVVHTTRDLIHLDASVRVDVDQLGTLAAEIYADSESACLDRASTQLVDLYRGPFLDGVVHLDWAQSRREELAALHLDLCVRLGRLALGQGRGDCAIRLARRVVREDPYREAAYRILVAAHQAQGDHASAQRVYDACRARLRADLQVDPAWTPTDLLDSGI